MNFNFERHARLAGSVIAIVGVFIHNWYAVVIGWTIVFAGILISFARIERYIEAQSEPVEEDEDAIR